MTEVILNDECVHCNDKECHDGEHFCNQAMKDNSFYKNAKLYKGLEVIQRPTYEELEKENTSLKDALEGYKQNAKWCDKCNKITDLEKKNKVLAQNLEDTEIINNALEKENAELKSIADFQTSSNMDRHFQLKRSKKLLKQWLSLCGFKVEKLAKDTEQFLNSEVEK